jgi:hypothetical protein
MLHPIAMDRYLHGIFCSKDARKLAIVYKLLQQSGRVTNIYKLTRTIITEIHIFETLFDGKLSLLENLKLMIHHMKYDIKYRHLVNISNKSHGVGSLLRTDILVCWPDISP